MPLILVTWHLTRKNNKRLCRPKSERGGSIKANPKIISKWRSVKWCYLSFCSGFHGKSNKWELLSIQLMLIQSWHKTQRFRSPLEGRFVPPFAPPSCLSSLPQSPIPSNLGTRGQRRIDSAKSHPSKKFTETVFVSTGFLWETNLAPNPEVSFCHDYSMRTFTGGNSSLEFSSTLELLQRNCLISISITLWFLWIIRV